MMNAFDKIKQALDIQFAEEVAERLTTFKTHPDLGYRTAGSTAEHEAAQFLEKTMADFGLDNVNRQPFKLDGWTFSKSDLFYEGQKFVLGGYPMHWQTDGPQSFQLVDAGRGHRSDYAGKDVKGKLVLIRVNQRDDAWINYPAYEAYHQGAAGVLAIQDESFAEVSPHALNTNNFNGPDYLHCLSISQADADVLIDALSQADEITVQLDVSSIIERDQATSYNVWGEIPGENDNEIILVSAHYDAYYAGYQDNATAVGMMLAIAKALVDSNYRPNHRIVFLAPAAEEWGAINSRFDWLIGSYQQVHQLMPEWRDQTIVNINFEMPGIQNFATHYILASGELVPILRDWTSSIDLSDLAYSEGIEVSSPLDTWADDFSFATAGIPSLRNDFSNFPFGNSHYHSQFDTADTLNRPAFLHNHQLYAYLIFQFDQQDKLRLDFSYLTDQLNSDYIDDEFRHRLSDINLLTQSIKQEANRISHAEWNTKVKDIFQLIQDAFIKIDWLEAIQYGHIIYANKQVLLENLKQTIQSDKLVNWRPIIEQIDANSYEYNYSRATTDYYIDYVFNQPADRQFWGQGRVDQPLRLTELIELENKYAGEKLPAEVKVEALSMIDHYLKINVTLLNEAIEVDRKHLQTLTEKLNQLLQLSNQ